MVYESPGLTLPGLWLSPTPLKNDGVKASWDDDIPNWMESHNPFMFQTTNQYEIHLSKTELDEDHSNITYHFLWYFSWVISLSTASCLPRLVRPSLSPGLKPLHRITTMKPTKHSSPPRGFPAFRWDHVGSTWFYQSSIPHVGTQKRTDQV